MLHRFFDFENFDLDEYEHYEVTFSISEHGTDVFGFAESRKWRFELDCTQEIIGFFWPTRKE